jgi:hypothetical protein
MTDDFKNFIQEERREFLDKMQDHDIKTKEHVETILSAIRTSSNN